MDWLKRNLFLVASAAAALVVIGGAGWYFFSKTQADKEAEAQLTAAREALTGLQGKTPFPNEENVKAAAEQAALLTNFVDKTKRYFGTLSTNKPMSNAEFSSALVQSIADLQRAAKAASVTLPTNFAFSFSVQRELLQFDATNIARLYSQLEDVKAISSVLFAAHVYELIGIQRAPASTNDNNSLSSQPADYLSSKQVLTNDMARATLAPYLITFKGTSTELAAVLDGMALARYGFFVKWIKVEPGDVAVEGEGADSSGMASQMIVPRGMTREMAMRYGLGRRGAFPGQAAAAPAQPTAPPPPKKAGVILKEKPLKMAVMVEVIKIAPGA